MNEKIIDILIGNKHQVTEEWLRILLSIPNSNYLQRPRAELVASAEAAMQAYIEVLRYDSYEGMDNYVYNVSFNRIQLGFNISEVTQALLMAEEALLPFLLEEFSNNPKQLIEAVSIISRISHRSVARFNHFYSRALNQQLQDNLENLREHDRQLAQQKEKLERKVRQNASLIQSASVLNSTLELDRVLKYIVEQACDLIGTKNGIIYELHEESKALSIMAARSSDFDIKKYENTKISVGDEFLEFLPRDKQILRIHDIKDDSRNEFRIFSKSLIMKKFRAILAVPLIRKHGLYGGIAVFFPKPHQFSEESVSLLTTFSTHAALAIDNARLYEKTRQAAVLRERNRLAREIHDTLAQGLAGILLQLEAIDRLIVKNVGKAREEIQKVKESVRRNLQEARRSVWGLRAGDSIQLSLIDSIKSEIEKNRLESNLNATFEVTGEIYDFAPEAESNIFRIVQEAMNNVLQHANARHVWIKLKYGCEVLTIQIKDDGVGLKSLRGKNSNPEKGFGLMGMQERARFLNGELNIESSENAGTTVTVHIPARYWQNAAPGRAVLDEPLELQDL
ncbi:GAF domain-containing sensor histidine kinase [candidate division KSB1 bacterium]|nr:GAF domain-containing sensor histidine kinase [candidate division KSB1 bacterium]